MLKLKHTIFSLVSLKLAQRTKSLLNCHYIYTANTVHVAFHHTTPPSPSHRRLLFSKRKFYFINATTI